MKITGLDHFQLAMPLGAEAEGRWFYGDLLGLEELPKPQALRGRGGCWFEGPGVQIHLGVQSEGFVPSRKGHPAFLVADIDQARLELEKADLVIVPDAAVPGVRRLYVQDPFGNRLEFLQDGDGFSQNRP